MSNKRAMKQEQFNLLVEIERILEVNSLNLEDRELAVLHNLQYDLGKDIEESSQSRKTVISAIDFSLAVQKQTRLKPQFEYGYSENSCKDDTVEPESNSNPYIQKDI